VSAGVEVRNSLGWHAATRRQLWGSARCLQKLESWAGGRGLVPQGREEGLVGAVLTS
jgi:hypothetical protein